MTQRRLKFGQPAAAFRSLSDEELLRSIDWANSAPGKLVEAARNGDVDTFARRLKKTDALSRRGGRQKRVRLAPAAAGFAGWSQPRDTAMPLAEMVALLEAFGMLADQPKKKVSASKKKKKDPQSNGKAPKRRTIDADELESRLNEVLDTLHRQTALSPFELLVLVELLLTAGKLLAPQTLFRTWRTALQGAVELRDFVEGSTELAGEPDVRLLTLGELPFLSGMLFRDIRGAERFIRDGRKFLGDELLDATDGDGTPRADLLERLPLWIAPLVRASYWSRELSEPLWNEDAEERFRRLLSIVARFCRSDGRPALSNGFQRDVASLLNWASPLAGWKKSSPPLQFLTSIGEKTPRRRKASRLARETGKSKRPVAQSDWARVACLRNDWSAEADSLVVAHHREKPLIDLTALGVPLLEGMWDIEISIDGKPLTFLDRWTCTCWFSDKDADYIEVQLTFESGVQVERQLLLSRKEHFVLLADVISGANDRAIEYVSRLPLVAGVQTKPGSHSRECRLTQSRLRARVYPLALPDDRVMSTSGSFQVIDSMVELKQQAVGGTYAPVVIDWHPDRRRAPAEWKSLTVTEQRQVLRPDTASGHRLRVGDLHLFVYRSVAKSHEISRSVLGHHTSYESVVGRFDKYGDVEPLLVVE